MLFSTVKWGDFDRFFTFFLLSTKHFKTPDLSHLASSENMPEKGKHRVSSLQSYGNIAAGILVKVAPHKWGDFDKLNIFS